MANESAVMRTVPGGPTVTETVPLPSAVPSETVIAMVLMSPADPPSWNVTLPS